MQLLITPTLTGTDFVTPYYNRRKYDGAITNFLCYPITRSLFGKNIRQPIGGDFGLSIELVKDILDSKMWEIPDVSRFGIDIFETYTALAKDCKIKQARLGIKSHDTKDPASQLASMFKQVVYTMFTCIERYDSNWKEIHEVTKVEMVGEAEYEDAPEPIEISLSATMDTYKNNYDKYLPVYESVLDQEIQRKFEQLKLLESSNIDLSSEVWAKAVYSFIAAFHKSPVYGRDRLIDALRALWIARIAHFLKETSELRRDEAEKRILEEAVVFENLKPYLIEKYF